jgi:putative oxidoreductase
MDAKISLVARLLLGLMYAVFGCNYFFEFIPLPPPVKDSLAAGFMGSIFASKFLLAIKVIEIACGAMLLAGLLPRLAAVLIMPISVGILLFHGTMAPEGMVMGGVLVVINAVLLYSYRESYKPMLT